MVPTLKRIASVTIAASALLVVGCGGGDDDVVPGQTQVKVEDFATAAGYWEGEGRVDETPLDDGVRKLTRAADFDFWFSLNSQGVATGEITLTYESVLTVDGLPSLSVPGVGGVSAGFNPEVGGEITDTDPKRIFPLVGAYNAGEGLRLAMVPGEDPDPIEFTIRADPGVSAGFDVGGAGSVGINGEGAGTMAYVIDMTPFTPFADTDIAAMEKRPGGPYAAHFELSEDTFTIEWSAVQESSDTQTVVITSEMRQALDALQEALQ